MEFEGKKIFFDVDSYADSYQRKSVRACNAETGESFGDITLNMPQYTLDPDELILSPAQKDIIDEMVKSEYLVIMGEIQTYKGSYKTARLTQKFENEFGYAVGRWIKTDDLQYVLKVAAGHYKLVEARYAEDKYIICRDEVSIKDWLNDDGFYDEECVKIIKAYYSSVPDFEKAYENRNMREQVLAEMLFEETGYDLTDKWELVPDDIPTVESKLQKYMKDF